MNSRLLIGILASLSMLGAISIDAYLPALPAIAHDFTISLPIAQQSLTIYLCGYAFMVLFYGTLSDSFGRRSVIIGSLVLYLLSSIGAALSQNLVCLMLFRLLQGLSAGGGGVVGRAMVADLFTGAEAQRVMAFISMVFGIAPAIAPILGGWLQAAAGWRSIFYFIVAFTLVQLLVCLRWLPESLAIEKRHPFQFKLIMANYWKAGAHPQFLFKCIGNAFSFSGVLIYVGSAPVFVMDMLHLSVKEFAWLFIPMIGGMTLGSFLSARFGHHYAPRIVIRAGYAVMALAAVVNLFYTWFFAVSVPWAVIPPFVYGVGMCYAMPAMSVMTLEMFPTTKGLASSLFSFTFMIIFAGATGLICPLLFASAFHLAAGVAVGLALSWIFWSLGTPASEGAKPTDHIATPEEFPIET